MSDDEPIELYLFISGSSPRSIAARKAAQDLVAALGHGRCQLIVADVQMEPDMAESFHILATPTMVRQVPAPPARVIGDLSNVAEVARHLSLSVARSGALTTPTEDQA